MSRHGRFLPSLTRHASRVNLLGPHAFTLGGANGLALDKLRALLAYLAVEPGRLHRRDTLASLLWPEATNAIARRGSSQAPCNLCQSLSDAEDGPAAGARYLLVRREHTQMNPEPNYALDMARFCGLPAEAARHSYAAHERD